MKILKYGYEKITGKEAPYYYEYSFLTIIKKPIRKWLVNSFAADCPFNIIRILIYRLCGFHIGRNVFIGMKCYLDDTCYDLLTIEDDVKISYGVYFACHGIKQGHYPITVKKGAYIGMRASIISKNTEKSARQEDGVTIGENAIIASCALVNRDIPAGCTAVGIPCRIIKKDSR